jgi:hypothetical protein
MFCSKVFYVRGLGRFASQQNAVTLPAIPDTGELKLVTLLIGPGVSPFIPGAS